MWEVFNPTDGIAIETVRYKLTAKIICWLWQRRGRFLDYARVGEGY